MPVIPIKQGLTQVKRARAEALDSALTFLFLAEDKSISWISSSWRGEISRTTEAFNRLPLRHFDGADVSRLYESLGETTSYARTFLLPENNDDLSSDWVKDLCSLPQDWDSCGAVFFSEAPDHFREIEATYLFSLQRHRTVPLKEVRGLFKLHASSVVERSDAHVFNNGSYVTHRDYVQYFNGNWHCVGSPTGQHAIVLPRNEQVGLWRDRSRALTNEYDWHVHIGLNVNVVPTLSIPSDPVSSRDIFKLRDIPAGKSRREALKHWVSGHVRQRMEPNYVESYIWPYLRGAEEFTWSGLYCKIQPSAFDLRKAREYQMIRRKVNAGMVV